MHRIVENAEMESGDGADCGHGDEESSRVAAESVGGNRHLVRVVAGVAYEIRAPYVLGPLGAFEACLVPCARPPSASVPPRASSAFPLFGDPSPLARSLVVCAVLPAFRG